MRKRQRRAELKTKADEQARFDAIDTSRNVDADLHYAGVGFSLLRLAVTNRIRHTAFLVAALLLLFCPERVQGQTHSKAHGRQWYQLGGIGGYGGTALGVGTYDAYWSSTGGWSKSATYVGWALRGGVLVGRTELGLDVSFWVGSKGDPLFGTMAAGGYYIPLYERRGSMLKVYLPVRGGLGFEGTDRVHFVARMDPFGLALQVSFLMFELNGTVRYVSTFDREHRFLKALMLNMSFLI